MALPRQMKNLRVDQVDRESHLPLRDEWVEHLDGAASATLCQQMPWERRMTIAPRILGVFAVIEILEYISN